MNPLRGSSCFLLQGSVLALLCTRVSGGAPLRPPGVFCSGFHGMKSEGRPGWVPSWGFWDKPLLLIRVLAEFSSVRLQV